MVFTMCTQRTQVETPTEFQHLRGMENHDLGAPKVNKNQYLEVKIGDKINYKENCLCEQNGARIAPL